MESAQRRGRPGPEEHALRLSNLGAALRVRYERLDRRADGTGRSSCAGGRWR
jgi:hypothetical protein